MLTRMIIMAKEGRKNKGQKEQNEGVNGLDVLEKLTNFCEESTLVNKGKSPPIESCWSKRKH